jgi:hypothetical protein
MACGASFFDDSPEKEKEREQRREKRDKEEIGRLTDFFAANVGDNCIDIQYIGGSRVREVKKIYVTKGNGELIVEHRGYRLTVACDPDKWQLELERWNRMGNMSHARVIRQEN